MPLDSKYLHASLPKSLESSRLTEQPFIISLISACRPYFTMNPGIFYLQTSWQDKPVVIKLNITSNREYIFTLADDQDHIMPEDSQAIEKICTITGNILSQAIAQFNRPVSET